MKALAQWAMASRKQAMLAVAICFAIPFLFWLGAALLALVILRQGWREGASILAWAGLPALAWLVLGDLTPAVSALGVSLMASVLRQTVRLDYALLVAPALGVGLYFALPLLVPDMLVLLHSSTDEMLAEALKGQTELLAQLKPLIAPMLSGTIAAVHTLVCMLCLLLGRYWQSELYNPDGFGQEFRQLRLPMLYSLSSVLLLLGASVVTPELAGLLPVLTVPMALAALALLHFVVAKKQVGSHWLVLAYAALLMFGPYVYTLLIFVALLDSAMHLRSRLKDTA